MASQLTARIHVTPLAGGRGRAVGATISTATVSGELPWAWVATLRVGERVATTGMDSQLESNARWGERAIDAGPLWLPARTEHAEVEIDVALRHGKAGWEMCSGRSALGDGTFVLSRRDMKAGEPFTAPVGAPRSFSFGSPPRSMLIPGRGVLEPMPVANSCDFSLRSFDGTPRPLPIPRPDPDQWGGRTERFLISASDRIALFRSHHSPSLPPRTLTLTSVNEPDRASHIPCYLHLGNFDASGTRFWFAPDEYTIAVVDTATGFTLRTHPLRSGESLSAKYLHRDHLFIGTATGFDSISVHEGTRHPSATLPAPPRLEMTGFDPATNRFAWGARLGGQDPLGSRTAVHWVDLDTFDGGEATIPDVIDEIEVVAGHVVAIGHDAWTIADHRARRLCRADGCDARLTCADGETRYWSEHAPPPGYVVL